jgi:hypothetical protein
LKKKELGFNAVIDFKKAETELRTHELDDYAKIHDAHLKEQDMHHKHFHESASLLHEIKQFEHESKEEKHEKVNAEKASKS